MIAFDKYPLKDAQQLPSAESLYDVQKTCGALLILVASFLCRQPPLCNQERQKRDPQAAQGGEGHVSFQRQWRYSVKQASAPPMPSLSSPLPLGPGSLLSRLPEIKFPASETKAWRLSCAPPLLGVCPSQRRKSLVEPGKLISPRRAHGYGQRPLGVNSGAKYSPLSFPGHLLSLLLFLLLFLPSSPFPILPLPSPVLPLLPLLSFPPHPLPPSLSSSDNSSQRQTSKALVRTCPVR